MGQTFRDLELEKKILAAAYKSGFGAQFGGKYFVLDVRIIRLPPHGSSCPIGMGVSCVADRNVKAKINKDGIWLEELERNPGRLIPDQVPHWSGPDRGKHRSEQANGRYSRPALEVPGGQPSVALRDNHCRSGTLLTRGSKSRWTKAPQYRITLRNFRFTMQARPRPHRASRQALSVQRQPAAWIHMWISSSLRVALLS